MNQEKIAIGIDLGTYNSAASVNLGEEPVMLRPKEGQTDQGICFPSFVEFGEAGELIHVGEFARRSIPVNPEYVIWGGKRLIGKSFQEVKASGDLERFQYKVVEGRDGSCRICVGKKEYSPTDISSMVLKKIKEDAEANFNPIGVPIHEATITVPAYFSPVQRAETEMAARMAGFETVHLIPEPTAAALAYKVSVEAENQYVMVIDLGAGTLDVTVALMYLDDQGVLQTTEKGHSGNTALGGLDIDDAILEAVTRKHHLQNVVKDSHGRARLRIEIERAKIELSQKLDVPVRFSSNRGNVDIVLTRTEIEEAVQPVIDRCRGPIGIALREASMSASGLSHVLLVGGPTKMPVIRKMVMEEMGGNTRLIQDVRAIEMRGFPVNPMEAVARGAVMGDFGAITPHAYGVQVDNLYYALIPRRTHYPCSNAISIMIPGRRRSVALNLIQQAVDPQKNQEYYMMLGIFQFDYSPEPGQAGVQVEAEYTENGILNLNIVQPSTMVAMPLYNVSRLEGRKISKPSEPLQVEPPRFSNTYHVQQPGGGGAAPFKEEQISWNQHDLEEAIRASNRLMQITRARSARATAEDRPRIESILGELQNTISNSWLDLNTRVPKIRNLNRALLTILLASRLVERQEFQELDRGAGAK
jgi:molecular chaperone DnaK